MDGGGVGAGRDEAEFEKAQADSKEASKAQKKSNKETVKLDVHDIAALEKNPDVPKTDDSAKFGMYFILKSIPAIFTTDIALGTIQSKVVAVYHNRSFLQSTQGIPEDTLFGILLDKTPFYAESGGQEYDTGSIVIDDVAEFEVSDVQVFNGYVLHIGRLKYGSLSVGDEVVSSYDEVSRLYRYHTMQANKLTAPPLAIAQQPHRNSHP